jgi:hypothetical protein
MATSADPSSIHQGVTDFFRDVPTKPFSSANETVFGRSKRWLETIGAQHRGRRSSTEFGHVSADQPILPRVLQGAPDGDAQAASHRDQLIT